MATVVSSWMRGAWLTGLLVSFLASACGPAYRVTRKLEDAEIIMTREDGGGGEGGSNRQDATGGMGGMGGNGGTSGTGGLERDAAIDLPRDSSPDLPTDTAMGEVGPDGGPDMMGNMGKTVLLVMGYVPPDPLRPGDMKIKARLEGRGFTVRLGNDDDPDASKAMGANLVIITETSGNQIAMKYTTLNIPVICAEPMLFDDLRLTAAQGATANAATIEITQAGQAHPLAAAKMATVTIAGSALATVHGNPVTTALRIATMPGGAANQSTIFGYASGSMMSGVTAPAKRVGLFVSDAMANGMNDAGWQLFDAAVDWALQP